MKGSPVGSGDGRDGLPRWTVHSAGHSPAVIHCRKGLQCFYRKCLLLEGFPRLQSLAARDEL